jgi:hypothetical protein
LDNPTSGFTVNSVDAAKVAAMKAAELGEDRANLLLMFSFHCCIISKTNTR